MPNPDIEQIFKPLIGVSRSTATIARSDYEPGTNSVILRCEWHTTAADGRKHLTGELRLGIFYIESRGWMAGLREPIDIDANRQREADTALQKVKEVHSFTDEVVVDWSERSLVIMVTGPFGNGVDVATLNRDALADMVFERIVQCAGQFIRARDLMYNELNILRGGPLRN